MIQQEGYEAFLAYLFQRYVEPRIPLFRRNLHHRLGDEFGWYLEGLNQAMAVINFIERFCSTREDVHKIFTRRALAESAEAVGFGVGATRRWADEAGFLAVIDSHIEEILDGMRMEHFPPEDREALRDLGSREPEQDLAGLVYLKTRKRDLVNRTREALISTQLEQIAQRVSAGAQQLKEEPPSAQSNRPVEAEAPGRRWFKGLGQICQGAALAIADISLAVGALALPVSPETSSWGAIVSTTSGVGLMLGGVGGLRNE